MNSLTAPAGRAGLLLALLASAAAVAALAARAGIGDPGRVIAGTVMFAVIYLAIGALVTSPVNGAVLIFFVWILDVMFGPSFGGAARPFTRVFPTHFVTLWMTGMPSHHAGRIGDLGWALIWVAGAAVAAWAVLTTPGPDRRPASSPPGCGSACAAPAATGCCGSWWPQSRQCT